MQRQSFSEVQAKEKLIRRSNEAINEDLVDDTGADQDDDTSDAEKNSGSDDDEEDEDEKDPSPKSSPDVRKRRTRKAD